MRKEWVNFPSFSSVYDRLVTESRPVRVQTSASNCVLFALWTAVEETMMSSGGIQILIMLSSAQVLVEELPEPPLFISGTKVNPTHHTHLCVL